MSSANICKGFGVLTGRKSFIFQPCWHMCTDNKHYTVPLRIQQGLEQQISGHYLQRGSPLLNQKLFLMFFSFFFPSKVIKWERRKHMTKSLFLPSPIWQVYSIHLCNLSQFILLRWNSLAINIFFDIHRSKSGAIKNNHCNFWPYVRDKHARSGRECSL